MPSLIDLADIVFPAAPAWWPLAGGAMLLLVILLLVLVLLSVKLYLHVRNNHYRRLGLQLLGTATTAHEVSVILKRVALAAFPRETVASLYGDDWIEFLHHSCSNCQFRRAELDSPTVVSENLLAQARHWVRNHKSTLADAARDREFTK